jgi:hypothetical protein
MYICIYNIYIYIHIYIYTNIQIYIISRGPEHDFVPNLDLIYGDLGTVIRHEPAAHCVHLALYIIIMI